MKQQTHLAVNGRGVISGVGLAASIGGVECIVVAKNLRSLVRVWGAQNPGTPLQAKAVRKLEIRPA